MATIIVKHRIESWERWKPVFDAHEAARREHGWVSHAVHRGSDDPNTVVVVGTVSDVARAREFLRSESLKAAMMNAGVLGPPDVDLLIEAEERRY